MVVKNDNLIKEDYIKILQRLFRDSRDAEVIDYTSQIEKYRSQSKLKSSRFFYDLIGQKKRLLQEENRKPVVGYFCNVVPEEIVLASGGTPLRLCSSELECFKIGEEIIPGDVCPIIKSICGGVNNKQLEELDLLVVPGTCDGKVKMAEILSPVFSEKVYFLDIPRESNYLKNVEIWTEKYNEFYEYLKQKFNNKITRKELLKACQVTNKRTEVFRKIYEFRARNPGIVNSFDYFIMGSASFFTLPSIWAETGEKLYVEAMEMAGKGNSTLKSKRVLLSGAPIIFPNFKILEILEDIGCDVSSDTLCSTYGRLYDPVEIDEETEIGIIRSLALKYIAPSMCPCFIGMDKLIDFMIDTVKEYKLDGLIYYNLRLCQVFDIQTVLIRQILKENNIPFLSLKTDLGREDIGQLKTRIEAFLEMLE